MTDSGAVASETNHPRRRSSDRTEDAVRLFNLISTKQGLGAAFGLLLLLFFMWDRYSDRQDRREEQRVTREFQQKDTEKQIEALQAIARAMDRQADVMSDIKATLRVQESLLRVQTQEDLKPKITRPIYPENPKPQKRALFP